jgi:hypothetical protein
VGGGKCAGLIIEGGRWKRVEIIKSGESKLLLHAANFADTDVKGKEREARDRRIIVTTGKSRK